jgi:CheY-like chemotaxis protein
MTKVLLVEDDKSLREIYGVRLLAEGYDIVSAGDGEEALAMAIKERPQLIVSDVMMPKISGFDMLDILRSTTETKDIKVIMMTALSSEDQRARGEALGADRYLVKSQVGIEDVVRAVHEVLADAPVSRPSAPQSFGGAPAPAGMQSTGGARPSTPAVPARPVAAPTAPTPAPASPQPAAPAQPSGLPRPTAPFSTTRPANLGDRVIHPITPAPGGTKPDLGSLMDKELSSAAPAPSAPAFEPAAPAQPSTPTPALPPLPTPPAPPMPQSTPAPAAEPTAPSTPAAPQVPDISFEETPRSETPPSGPQPPSVS